jgi:P27 family predicted phage terminase small subunit
MRGRRPELKAIDGALATGAPRPSHIPKAAHVEWDRVTADLRARKLLTPSMLGTVASYVIATWQVAECVEALEADGSFVRTKTGEPKPHPALGMLSKASDLVARLGAELGLTPAARSRKGLRGPGEPDDEGKPSGLDI